MTAGASKTKKRPSYPSSSAQKPRSQQVTATRTKSVSLETEEVEDQNDVDPYENWSTHSAEIAKYVRPALSVNVSSSLRPPRDDSFTFLLQAESGPGQGPGHPGEGDP